MHEVWHKMEVTLLAVVLAVCRCALCKEAHIFDGDVVNFAVGVDKLYVLTDTQLHQMRLDLSPETRKEISNATTSNKVELLVTFVYNGTVITCGSHNTGYCEVLDSYNISKTIHKEGISIGAYPHIAVLIGHEEDTYLLVGKNIEKSSGVDADALVTLRDTEDGQFGGIFSKSDLHASPSSSIQNIPGTEIEFVDGFQHTASSHVYLLLNEKRGSKLTVKLLSLDSKYTEKDGKYTKAGTFKTLQGAILQCCEGDVVRPWKLLSSAVIPGESPILWAGVFQMNVGDTVVAIFDISRSRTAPVSGFCINKGDSCESSGEEKSNDKVLRPAAVVFRNSSITSVAALKSNFWIVLFFGTKNGLLIKVALDEALKPGCPGVLYSLDEDRTFFPKMLFDPVNPTDVYVAQGKQMIKVPVARCGVYQTLGDCWSALDPFCGWCVSQSRCRFQHDCSNSDWVSVPGTSQQRDIMSVHMIRSSTGQDITVTAAPNLNGGIRPSCALEKCDSPGPSNCSCTFSSESFPAEGLRVTITVQTETLTKDVLLKNCSSIRGRPTYALCMECFSAGCVWTLSGACTWRTASSENLLTTQDVCKMHTTEMDHKEAEEPSLYGSAVGAGRSLEEMGCSPLKPDVRPVRVCVLPPDGHSYGATNLNYSSATILPYVVVPLYSILGVLALVCYFHMKKREDEAAENASRETTKPALMCYFMKKKREDDAAETAAPHSRETTKSVTMEMNLRVVVHNGDIRKVTLSSKPASVQALIHQLEKTLQLECKFSLQYEDPDFSNALCNLNDIRALPERPTLKIIPIRSPPCSR
ncbi:plexin-C1-like isoform X2 [Alosa pseudoharengus]|uniref:plexin-C1-like isoform X2 n=1 Tax=Alosa pseudoharengus TaxID=34774 RepID=UPI003F8C700B